MSWKRKNIGAFLLGTLLVLSMSGCKKGGTDNTKTVKDPYGIMPQLAYSGNLDILVYIQGMDGETRDIGNDKITTEELTDGNLQKYHAVAKEFKKLYPNIKVNLIYDSIDNYTDRLISYQESHNGQFPHIMHLPYTVQEGLGRGYSADLQKYKYLKLYDAIDPSVWEYFTFGDFVAAVPFYVYPTGIFVNKGILETNYLYDPAENLLDKWTLDEMTDMLKTVHNVQTHIGGTGVLSSDLINIISDTVDKTLLSNKNVNLDTLEIEHILQKEYEIASASVWDYQTKSIKQPFDQIKPWSYNTNFIDDELYTMEMARSYCAVLYSQLIKKGNKEGKFDFMPFPKLNEDSDFRIGVIAEGLTVGNQCPLDMKCTQKLKDAEEAAAAFALFMAADTRSIKSIAHTPFMYQGELVSGNFESLPVIRKDITYPYNENKTQSYDEETFLDPDNELNDYQVQLNEYLSLVSAFADQEGFKEVLRIFTEEKHNAYAYNTIPRSVPLEQGGTEDILEKWNNRFTTNGTISAITWVDNTKRFLSDWTKDANSNIQTAYDLLQDNLDDYYGKGVYNVFA